MNTDALFQTRQKDAFGKIVFEQMKKQLPKIFLFCGLCGIFGLLSILGSSYLSKVKVTHHPANEALQDCFSNFKYPIGTIFLLSPFLAVGLIAAIFSERNFRVALCFLIFSLPLLVGVYLYGYFGSEQALLDKAWTAASLSVGLLPFLSVPIIGVSFAISLGISKFPKSKN